MSYIPYQFPLTGGLDRSAAPCRANLANFYTLANFRQSNTVRGKLEQTPRFTLSATAARGTYWTGAASATEPASSSMRWYGAATTIGQQLTITDYCAFLSPSSTQLKSLFQSAVPTATAPVAATKGCLLKVNNSTTMSVNLGATYDVVIDGAATFKWRVNAGAYTTLVAINYASGNAIDGGTIQLYWENPTSAAYIVNDTWSWTRTDAIFDTNYPMFGFVSPVLVNDRFFFSNGANRICTIEVPATGNPYVRSVGYRPVYGQNVGVSDNHLFVFGTDNTGTSAGVQGRYMLTSDLNNFDQFIPTDVNESDIYSPALDTVNAIDTFNVLNGFVLQNRIFVLTTAGIYYADYEGLPNVYKFKKLTSFRMTGQVGICSVVTNNGIYFGRTDGVFFFDGATVRLVCNLTTLGYNTGVTHIAWSPFTDEVLFYLSASFVILVYQERYGTWYTRAADLPGVTEGLTMVNVRSDGVLFVGLSSRRLLAEDTTFVGTPAFDATSGTAFAVPTITTQLIGTTAAAVKEIATLYLAAAATTGTSSTYSVANFTKVVLSWFPSNSGLISGSPTTDPAAYWSPNASSGLISYPRQSYRYIAFQLTLTGTDGTKPPGQTTIQAIETDILEDRGVKR